MRLSRAQRAGRSPRAYALLGAIAMTLIVFALFVAGTPRSSAQTTGTCTLPVGGITTCSFVTTTNVPAGGSMTISLTNPTGASITALPILPSGVRPGNSASEQHRDGYLCRCQPRNSVPREHEHLDGYNHRRDHLGCRCRRAVCESDRDLQFQRAVSDFEFNRRVLPRPHGSSSVHYHLYKHAHPGHDSGGTLTLIVTAAPGQTIQVPLGGAPLLAGTCPLTTALPTTPGTNATVTYSCGAGQMAPALPISLTVTNAPTASSIGTVHSPPDGGFIHYHLHEHARSGGERGWDDYLYRYCSALPNDLRHGGRTARRKHLSALALHSDPHWAYCAWR